MDGNGETFYTVPSGTFGKVVIYDGVDSGLQMIE